MGRLVEQKGETQGESGDDLGDAHLALHGGQLVVVRFWGMGYVMGVGN